MTTLAKEIVRSVGMSDDPKRYFGRVANTHDLDGNKLYAIYQEIQKKLGATQATAFVTMVKEQKTLAATHFLNSLYTLEEHGWVLSFSESDTSATYDNSGEQSIALVILSTAMYSGKSFADDTEYIRNSFLKKLKSESERAL